MKNNIKGIGSIENGKIDVNQDIKGDILENQRNTLIDIRNKIAQEAKKYIGYPSIKYKDPKNGINEDGFDCSGFITHILKKFGLAKDEIRHANEYFDSYGISIHREVIQPGDLIFFSKNGLVPKHIGIVISDSEYIHAPGKDNTKIEIQKIKDEKIEKNTPGKIYTHNPIGFKRIILETPENKFDFNGTKRKRRAKIV